MIVWDPVTASATQRLQGHKYQVTALALLPSGEIASASLDRWAGGRDAVGEGGGRWDQEGGR